jgi:hypothetical protein
MEAIVSHRLAVIFRIVKERIAGGSADSFRTAGEQHLAVAMHIP